MKILVTGGTGFVGSHTVAELLKNGHEVRLLVRSEKNIRPALDPFGIADLVDAVPGNVLDRDAVVRAAQGCDATIHCGSVYSLDPRAAATIGETNVKGTQNVLEIARELGHDPIVHVSSFVALIGDKGTILTPDSPVTNPPGAYFRSKADSDRIARSFQGDGVPVVITYPGSVWGPDDPHYGESCQIARTILKGNGGICMNGNLIISDVRDVARLHAAVMEKNRGPRRFFAPMHTISLQEVINICSELTGRNLQTATLPHWFVLSLMKGLDVSQRFLHKRLPFNYQAVYCTSLSHRADDTRTINDFNIHPLSLEETIADQIRWMLKRGFITSRLAGKLSRP